MLKAGSHERVNLNLKIILYASISYFFLYPVWLLPQIFTFFQYNAQESSSKCFGSSKTSRISMVDLAGFERTLLDDASRQHVKEGKYVKKSTSQLGYEQWTSLKHKWDCHYGCLVFVSPYMLSVFFFLSFLFNRLQYS